MVSGEKTLFWSAFGGSFCAWEAGVLSRRTVTRARDISRISLGFDLEEWEGFFRWDERHTNSASRARMSAFEGRRERSLGRGGSLLLIETKGWLNKNVDEVIGLMGLGTAGKVCTWTPVGPVVGPRAFFLL